MYKLFACVVLLGGIAAVGTIDAPRSIAQVKKDAKKDDKGAGTVEISEGKDGKFRFSVRNADGKYIGGSGPVGFASDKDARAAIDELKHVLATAKITTKKGDAKDKAKDK
jgi:hypothetical protein